MCTDSQRWFHLIVKNVFLSKFMSHFCFITKFVLIEFDLFVFRKYDYVSFAPVSTYNQGGSNIDSKFPR